MQIESSGRFSKNIQISKFMKIRLVEATCSMRSGRRTDRHDSLFEILRTRLKRLKFQAGNREDQQNHKDKDPS